MVVSLSAPSAGSSPASCPPRSRASRRSTCSSTSRPRRRRDRLGDPRRHRLASRPTTGARPRRACTPASTPTAAAPARCSSRSADLEDLRQRRRHLRPGRRHPGRGALPAGQRGAEGLPRRDPRLQPRRVVLPPGHGQGAGVPRQRHGADVGAEPVRPSRRIVADDRSPAPTSSATCASCPTSWRSARFHPR
jgi:hypothetical protein